MMSVATRVYRLCLRLYPTRFRAEFGDEMAGVFAEHLAEAKAQGQPAVWALLAREIGAVVGGAARESVAELRLHPARVWQTSSGARVAVASTALRLVKILALGLLAGPLVVGFCLGAVEAVWSWQENAPSVNDVALADLNGDGSLDAFLAVGRGNMPFPAYVLYNDGNGRLGGHGRTDTLDNWPGYAVALGDLNGDGRVDALLDITGGGVVAYLNGPDGFRDHGALAAPGPKPVMRVRPVIGDLNGDGHLDVFGAGCCGRQPGEAPWSDPLGPPMLPYSQAWLNSGDREPVLRNHMLNQSWLTPGILLGQMGSNAAALADLNGDGTLDVFLANGRTLQANNQFQSQTPNTVWLNAGRGELTDSGQRLGQSESLAVVLGDVDGDGCVDAVVGNRGPDEIWLNDCQGAFQDSGQRLGSGSTESLFVADLDSDGDLDWLAAGPTEAQAWLNDGDGRFEQSRQRLRYSADDAVALGDLNGDGLPDVLVAGVSATRAWLNDGQGWFAAATSTRYR